MYGVARKFSGLLVALTLILPAFALAQSWEGGSTRPNRIVAYAEELFTAENWVKNTSYATVGVRVVNAGNVYQVTTAGTSENTDNAGPKTTSTGYPSDITDGTVHWKWLGATGQFGIDNTSTAGEAAITATVVDVAAKNLDSLTFIASATGTSSDRVLTISCMAKDKTTALYTFPTVAVAANSTAAVIMRPGSVQPQVWPPWKASTAYVLGNQTTNGGNVYEVITAGTSASSGGPTTTAADITDGTAHWKFLGVLGVQPTGVTYLNHTPCPRVKASMAAISAGSGITASLAVFGRTVPGVTKPFKVQYESGSVGSGAALSSGTIDTSALESMQILVEATTTNRTLVVSCMSKYDKVLFSFANVTVTAANKYLLSYRFDNPIPGYELTNATHLPTELCPFMKASIAATGGASAKLAVYAR